MPPRLPPQLLAGRMRAARYVSPSSCAPSSVSSSSSSVSASSSIWPGRPFSLLAARRQPLSPAAVAAARGVAAAARKTIAATTTTPPAAAATYTSRRTLADSAPKPPAETEGQAESLGARPNEDVLPHVSEEAAAIGRIISGGGAAKGDGDGEGGGGGGGGGGDSGELGPDLGQGTPVEEILQRDPDAQEKAPQVIKEELSPEDGQQHQGQHESGVANVTSYSSLEEEEEEEEESDELSETDEDSHFTEADSAETASSFAGPDDAVTSLEAAEAGSDDAMTASESAGIDLDEEEEEDYETDETEADAEAAGSQLLSYYERVPAHQQPANKFELPPMPLPPHSHLKKRYDEVVGQVTRLMMQHGKLGAAQRNMAVVLSYLRAAPPPVLDPQHPLLPGAPPPQQLPLDPVRYLTLAIDSVAPLFRIRSQRGAAGGGQALLTPVPLRERQRRRTAVMWILGAASKRPSRGTGKDDFARRVAEEVIAVVEGRSAAWEKRMALHKLSVSIRGNVADPRRRGRR